MPSLPHLSRFRSPQFWVLFTALALAAAVFARTQFSTAFPLLDQKLSMTRDAATAAAQGLAGQQKWSQSSARTATRLYEDSTLTTFIELGPGKVLSEIFSGAGEDLVSYHLSGSLDKPVIEATSLHTLRDALEEVGRARKRYLEAQEKEAASHRQPPPLVPSPTPAPTPAPDRAAPGRN